MAETDVPLAEQYTAKLKARAQQLPDALRDFFLDYLVPVLEEQREEYVGGFEEVGAQLGEDDGFRGRVVQALAAVGALNDALLKRAGWADANGQPVPECPDDLKIAFGSAQALVTSVISEIQENEDDDDDGTDEAA
jgi:hypothetical protein